MLLLPQFSQRWRTLTVLIRPWRVDWIDMLLTSHTILSSIASRSLTDSFSQFQEKQPISRETTETNVQTIRMIHSLHTKWEKTKSEGKHNETKPKNRTETKTKTKTTDSKNENPKPTKTTDSKNQNQKPQPKSKSRSQAKSFSQFHYTPLSMHSPAKMPGNCGIHSPAKMLWNRGKHSPAKMLGNRSIHSSAKMLGNRSIHSPAKMLGNPDTPLLPTPTLELVL